MFGFRRSVTSLVAKFDKLEDQLIQEAHALRADAADLEVQVGDLEAQRDELVTQAEDRRIEADRAIRIAARVAGITA